MSEEQEQNKFKPERPIYLNEENTGLKTKAEVIFAIEKLRSKKWLCAYGQKSRPFHMSFASEAMFQKFKKAAADLDINLKNPVIKEDEFDSIIQEGSTTGAGIEGAEDTDTVDKDGQAVQNDDEPSRVVRF